MDYQAYKVEIANRLRELQQQRQQVLTQLQVIEHTILRNEGALALLEELSQKNNDNGSM